MRDNEVCFRVRGIPHAFDKSETEKHVRRALSLGADEKIRIRSLAPEPYPPGEQMATVDFDARPECLSRDISTHEWNVCCDCGICIASGSGCTFTIDSHFRDVTALHRPKDEEWDMDVIALPGLGGHALGSFKSRESTEMWLRDYLPREFPGARIFTYGYDSHLVGSKSFQSVRDLGIKFRSALERIRKHSQKLGIRKPIVLIGHSFGGIVLKEAILRMIDAEVQHINILGSIIGIMFFGVPNHGMDIKSLLPMVQDQPNEDLVRALRQDSDLLLSQSERFSEQFSGEWQGVDFNKVKIFSFYETKTSPTAQMTDGTWKMNGPHTVLVGKSSATHGRPWESNYNFFVRPIDRTHSDLVKFPSRHDEDYCGVLYILQDLTSDERNLPPYHLSETEKECLHSLAFPEQDSRLRSIRTTGSTSAWLIEHRSYRDWLNLKNNNTLLSIVGHPGVGKSTLMKFAANNEKQRRYGQVVILAFFFDGKAKEDSILTRSSVGLYRSLLHQILSIRPDLFSASRTASILSVFKEKVSTRGRAGKDWKWHEEELRGLLSQILTDALTITPIFLFIDALDECDNAYSAKEIVQYFHDRISETSTTHSRFRLCISCRKHPQTMPGNIGAIQICVEEEEGHIIAIRQVVKKNLRAIQDDEKRYATQAAILSRAKGIFLWAILICMQAVEMADAGDSTSSIERMVKTVPPELDDLFEGLLRKIPKNQMGQSIELFQWICYATRPLLIKELQFALAIDAESEDISARELKRRRQYRENLDDVERAVRCLSRGLAEVRHISGQRKVQLIHQTVFQYLAGKGLDLLDSSRYTETTARTAAQLGHAQLARSCLKCLSMPFLDCPGRLPGVRKTLRYEWDDSPGNPPANCLEVQLSRRQDWVDVHEYIPLFDYAAKSVTRHMKAGVITDRRAGGILSRLVPCLADATIMSSWNRMFSLTELNMDNCSHFLMNKSPPKPPLVWVHTDLDYHTQKHLSRSFFGPPLRRNEVLIMHLDGCIWCCDCHIPWDLMFKLNFEKRRTALELHRRLFWFTKINPAVSSGHHSRTFQITVQSIMLHLSWWGVYKLTRIDKNSGLEGVPEISIVIVMPYSDIWILYLPLVWGVQTLDQLNAFLEISSRFESFTPGKVFIVILICSLLLFHYFLPLCFAFVTLSWFYLFTATWIGNIFLSFVLITLLMAMRGNCCGCGFRVLASLNRVCLLVVFLEYIFVSIYCKIRNKRY